MQDLEKAKQNKKKCCKCFPSCFIGTLVYLFALFLVLFLVVFVIVPFVFKYSVEVQRTLIFENWLINDNKNYSDFEHFKLKGARNFYVPVDDNITLGLWQILPQKYLSDMIPNEQYDYERILTNDNTNILLYLHGNGNDRSAALELYGILREQFHIIACDYRSYGDSSKATLTETGVVNDTVNIFKWIRERSKAQIYFWGHSLGTGVSTHTIANLKWELNATINPPPAGLILETPFTSVTDVVNLSYLVKFHSWLPWFKTTAIQPLIDNDFNFDSAKYILDVDCPIMILHAKDDDIVPYELATKLYETATENRNLTTQGNVTYHLFEAIGYKHMWIFAAPELPRYVNKFVKESTDFWIKSRNNTN